MPGWLGDICRRNYYPAVETIEKCTSPPYSCDAPVFERKGKRRGKGGQDCYETIHLF